MAPECGPLKSLKGFLKYGPLGCIGFIGYIKGKVYKCPHSLTHLGRFAWRAGALAVQDSRGASLRTALCEGHRPQEFQAFQPSASRGLPPKKCWSVPPASTAAKRTTKPEVGSKSG